MTTMEDAAEADLPFGGSIDLTDPKTVVVSLIALSLGFAFWNLGRGMGNQVSSWAAGVIASVTGRDPTGSGGNTSPDVV